MIIVSITADQDSATNGLRFEVSSDGSSWVLDEQYTHFANSGNNNPYTFAPVRKFFRIVFTNGTTDQTFFNLETIYKKTNSKASSHRIEDNINGEKDAELVKAVITGKNPHDTYVNFQATTAGNFKTSIEEIENNVVLPTSLPSTYFDDFGKLGVASPFKLIEYSANYPLDFIRYHSKTETGGGTVTRNATKTQIELATTTTSGDVAIFQTRRSVQYNKGNAQEILYIAKPNPLANRRERWGYFDENNGIFFEHDGTDARLVVRSNTSGSIVDTKFEQADWDDPLDGNGASGLTIDWTKQTVFKITFGWLSSRGIRFFIDIEGTFVLVKTYYISNSLVVPFTQTANLPIRFEVENTGTTAQSQTSCFSCFAVQSSGSSEQEGAVRDLNNFGSVFSATTTETIMTGIRLNSNFLNSSLKPLAINALPASGNTFCIIRLRYNPTLVTDVWNTATGYTYDTLTSVASFTGGDVISSVVVPLANARNVVNSIKDLLTDVYCGRDLNGTSDALVLTAQTSASNGTIYWTFDFKEFA